MTSKTFTSGTVVDSPWLNDVNTATYTSVPALQTKTANLPTVSTFAGTMMDDVDAAGVRTTIAAAASGANADITSMAALVSINGGQLAGLRNRIINGNFGVNQRAYVSGAAVGVGLYGHDRWKMAASGDTYTFSTAANVTTITIPAGKVLQQVIEGINLETGTYALSWAGTAQGKIGAGAYGASGITGSITGGTNTTIEFGPGTVSKVQLEIGSVATSFERRPYGMELSLCERYARPFPGFVAGQAYTTSAAFYSFSTGTTMRAAPTASAGTYQTSNSAATGITGTLTVNGMVGNTIRFDMTAVTGSPLVAGNATILSAPAGSMLLAEL